MKMKLTKNYLHYFDLISISNLSKKRNRNKWKNEGKK
jgi:hypothetical protein